MATTPRTLGEAVDQFGVCVLFDLVRQLAEARGRIPVGFWVVDLGDGWTLTVNGEKAERDHVPPYHARLVGVNALGWPVAAIVNPAGGAFIGATEAELEAVLQRAIDASPSPKQAIA